MGEGIVVVVEAEEAGNVDHPVVHGSPLGPPGHGRGQMLEEQGGAGDPAGKEIDPRPGAQLRPLERAERPQSEVVGGVEE